MRMNTHVMCEDLSHLVAFKETFVGFPARINYCCCFVLRIFADLTDLIVSFSQDISANILTVFA